MRRALLFDARATRRSGASACSLTGYELMDKYGTAKSIARMPLHSDVESRRQATPGLGVRMVTANLRPEMRPVRPWHAEEAQAETSDSRRLSRLHQQTANAPAIHSMTRMNDFLYCLGVQRVKAREGRRAFE